jgi:hypothetical protein
MFSLQYLSKKTTYTVTHLEGAIASGRAEPDIFFRKIWLCEPNFSEKEKKRTMLPQANRASIG